MMGSESLVIDLGDDMAKTPLSSHRRKQLTPMIQQPIDRSVSAVDFVDSLQDPPLSFLKSLGVMYRDRSARPALLLVALLLSFACAELLYSRWANSLCLVASAFFDLTDGIMLLVSAWGQAVTRSSRPTMVHSYGFDRYEVIGRFGTASYFAFVCLWIFFEGVERILEVEPTFIHGYYLVQIGTVGLGLQVLHVTVFRRVRSAIRGGGNAAAVSGVLAVGWEFLGDALVVLTGLAITYRGYFMLDTFVALFLTVLIAYQMIPVMVDMAMVLMQATPTNLPTARILREVSTVEGVVEVRKEHFWATSPSTFVATLRVRVRKECANEAAVLAKISDLVSPYVAHLTVQIEKDFL